VAHESRAGTRVSADHAPPQVVVASEHLDDDPGWSELSSGELVHVGSDLSVVRTAFRNQAPVRRMPA
jgi:glutamine amidotransferase